MAPRSMAFLDQSHDKARFGMRNPNLKAIADTKIGSAKFVVCGQYFPAEKIAPKNLTPNVILAADASLALIRYQNQG